MGLRSQIGWLRHGADRTQATLAAYEGELRALQDKVESMVQVVARLDVAVARIDAEGVATRAVTDRVATDIDAMKLQLRTITDDLGDRIGAVAERLDNSH